MLPTFFNTSFRASRPGMARFMSKTIQLPSAPGVHAQVVSDPQGPGQPSSSSSTPLQDELLTNKPAETVDLSTPSTSNATPVSETQAHPFAGAREYAENQEQAAKASSSNLPALPQAPLSSTNSPPTYARPPFDTHRFFAELERTFPSQTAHSLMRATRALLVDRIGKVRRDALTVKELENQAYLFRAALSEARNEITLRQKSDATSIRTSLAALKREIEALDNQMKSDIDNLKHEIQIDVDNRKTESRAELKQMDIQIEEVLNKAIVGIGDLRTLTEESKWVNMRRAVLALGFFAFSIVCIFEIVHRPKPPKASPRKSDEVLDDLEQQISYS